MTSSSSPPPRASEPGLDSPIAALPGLGPARAQALARHGIARLEDLLWRLPLRYEDRSRLVDIAGLEAGQPATLRVRVREARLHRTRRPGFSVVQARFEDPSGSLKVAFFNQPWLLEALVPGREAWLYGTPERERLFLELKNPQIEWIEETQGAVHPGRIVAIYEKIGNLGPRAHRALVARLLELLSGRIRECLPEEVLRAEGLLGREQAFREAHSPSSSGSLGTPSEPGPAIRRLAFEELFIQQFGLAAARQGLEERRGAPVLQVDDELRGRLRRMLPFRLTGAQRRVAREVALDLARERPMRRLLQGDVGSGKTIVAGLALGIAAGNAVQSALMAPTELLAEQHARTLLPLLEQAGIRAALLTGSERGRERTRILEGLAQGGIDVAIGTHALIQKRVQFHRLALVVVDEQHRFGVAQREALGEKGSLPHVLVMTATPIPRSLALTVYGDLDLSVLDELPPGRRPVRTVIKTAEHEDEAYRFLRRQVEGGAQAYVVCPLVEGSEKADLKAVEEWAETAAARWLKGLSVGLVHGRMKPAARQALMARFRDGGVQVLFGTTVIEVGVDVPNASVMIVEHAERFGLSQLHQLRGRIGRGSRPSTAVLVVRDRGTELARARLEAVRGSSDGFTIAEADLRLRGPGDLLGTRQWGLPQFHAASLLRDFRLLERARAHAVRLAADPRFLHGPGRDLLALYARPARTTGAG